MLHLAFQFDRNDLSKLSERKLQEERENKIRLKNHTETIFRSGTFCQFLHSCILHQIINVNLQCKFQHKKIRRIKK